MEQDQEQPKRLYDDGEDIPSIGDDEQQEPHAMYHPEESEDM